MPQRLIFGYATAKKKFVALSEFETLFGEWRTRQ
jgi:hypothetical protein